MRGRRLDKERKEDEAGGGLRKRRSFWLSDIFNL
jgi:hypothetical protein